MPAYVSAIFAFITLVLSFIYYHKQMYSWSLFAMFWTGFNFCLFITKAFP